MSCPWRRPKTTLKAKLGYDKLLIFIDSLSRWIEAEPFNGDPNSDQVLHTFMTSVVCRHGTPRELRSDAGSNFVSEHSTTIFRITGTKLRPTEAHHHEGVGLVERAQQTLVGLAKASDGGGRHWATHLPFYLMAMRASPNRVTHLSSAAILYGRELRLPAQLGDPRAVAETTATDSLPESIRTYTLTLQGRLQAAWKAAQNATREAQSDTVGETTRTKDTNISFVVGDRVCRRLPGLANKLEYFYSGPYRVTDVLPAGKYRLRDLENRMIKTDVHVSNLKPYYTETDSEPLQTDEFVVDSLLGRRKRGAERQHRVKWRGSRVS
jgi:hypothetical protein